MKSSQRGDLAASRTSDADHVLGWACTSLTSEPQQGAGRGQYASEYLLGTFHPRESGGAHQSPVRSQGGERTLSPRKLVLKHSAALLSKLQIKGVWWGPGVVVPSKFPDGFDIARPGTVLYNVGLMHRVCSDSPAVEEGSPAPVRFLFWPLKAWARSIQRRLRPRLSQPREVVRAGRTKMSRPQSRLTSVLRMSLPCKYYQAINHPAG